MRRLMFVIIILSYAGISVFSDEPEQNDDLLNLLNELESVKAVEEKHAPKPEESGNTRDKKPRRSPREIVKDISQTLKDVSEDLKKEEADGEKIVDDQKKIVKLIDEILDMASKSSPPPPQGGGGSSSGAKKPQPKTFTLLPPRGGEGIDGGGGGAGRSKDTSKERGQNTGDQWGNLPERVREDILQIFQEDIPLLYKDLLRLYFKNIDRE